MAEMDITKTYAQAVLRHSVKTNADRIRAMSDEELASKLYERNCPPGYRDAFVCGKSGFNCEECWLDWLKQEVEDG